MIRTTLIVIVLLGSAACRQDMHDQPRYKPLAASTFYSDGRSARPIPDHAVARDELNATDAIHTGLVRGDFAETIPVAVDLSLLQRGQDRYNIFCSPCHGRVGDGDGMVAQRGFHFPANFDDERLREAPPGYIFQVISNGYGAMGDYGDQIPDPRDRWAIVAYVRALQLSRHAAIADVAPSDRSRLGVAQ